MPEMLEVKIKGLPEAIVQYERFMRSCSELPLFSKEMLEKQSKLLEYFKTVEANQSLIPILNFSDYVDLLEKVDHFTFEEYEISCYGMLIECRCD